MQNHCLDLAEEPKGEEYTALLRFARRHCDQFSLIWHTQFQFKPSADEIAASLKPYLFSETMTDNWPGTQIGRKTALMRRYRLCRLSAEFLQIVNGLYAWLAPDLPEDLAFYSANGKCWLGTVSHEQMGFFSDESLSADELLQNVPGIVLLK